MVTLPLYLLPYAGPALGLVLGVTFGFASRVTRFKRRRLRYLNASLLLILVPVLATAALPVDSIEDQLALVLIAILSGVFGLLCFPSGFAFALLLAEAATARR